MEHSWHGILKIVELEHRDKTGKLLTRMENIPNLLHREGEGFILRTAFAGRVPNYTIPDYYYLGLDNRALVVSTDLMAGLVGEPSALTGYLRQSINTAGAFSVAIDTDHYIANGPVVAFRASGGNWGPVRNLFLTDRDDNSGTLISTAVLETPLTVADGEYVTLRIALSLRDYPIS